MALPLVQKNWGLFYFNSKLNFRHPPRSDKVDFWPIYRIALVDISAARTHDEWVNTDEHKRCTLLVVGGVEVGRGGVGWEIEERRRPSVPLGARNPSPYSEYSPWSSERDINLTLRLLAFICLWEMRSTAQMTVPILQIPLTVGVRTHKHKHIHTLSDAVHSWASASFPSSSVYSGGSLHCATVKVLIEEAVAALSLGWGNTSVCWINGLVFLCHIVWRRMCVCMLRERERDNRSG